MNNNYSSGGWKKYVWIYVVIAIVLYGGIYYYLKSKNAAPYSSPTSYSTTQSSTTTATSGSIITTQTNASGQYLADGNGRALYTYASDTSGVSKCSGACIADWPVYTATATTSLPANVTVITRADGTKQYAYKGLPLYYFSSDTQSGQVRGDGVNDFHLAKP